MNVFVVTQRIGYELEIVDSVWTSREPAEQRVLAFHHNPPLDVAYVEEFALNTPNGKQE